MLYWHAILWIFLLIALRGLIEFLPIPGVHDFFGLAVTVLVLSISWCYLGFRTQLRSFLLGVFFLLSAGCLDWFDDFFLDATPAEQFVDTMGELCLAGGVFFIGLAFVRVMLERDKLERKLFRQAYLDELTGLGNRRALFEKLDQLLPASYSGHLLYIDVNNFKQVNDRLGHEQGDNLLRECAAILKLCQGFSYRIGGDEFVLLLSAENPHAVVAGLAESAQPLTKNYGVSFSVGIAALSDEYLNHPDALIAAADRDMYAEKQRFRAEQRLTQQP
jgi:diguanylate cyclase (GGDEF)-like protein